MATAKTNTTKTATPTKKEKVVEIGKLHRQEKYTYKDRDGNPVKTYTFQFPGTREAERLINIARKDDDEAILNYHEALMETVIVDPPGVSFDYFDLNEGVREVVGAADYFLVAINYGEPYEGQDESGEELE